MKIAKRRYYMDYEKEYKRLVAKIKNAHLYAQTDSTKNVLEDILPTLTESNDDRIRKCIRMALTDVNEQRFKDFGTTLADCLAYLEKQKENVEKEYVFRPMAGTDITIAAEQSIRRAKEGEHLVLAFNGMYTPVSKYDSAKGLVDKYNTYLEEQQPAEWSEEDEDCLMNVKIAVKDYFGEGYAEESALCSNQVVVALG